VKFYLDENVAVSVADIARGRCGLDIRTARDVEGLGWPDAVQLRNAALDGRCLVTRDRDDFLALTLESYEAQAPHAGVLVIPRTVLNAQAAMIAAALRAFAERFPVGMQPYTIMHLPLQ
jgi:predicted nuclease of predicted toxin-antitoxin system